MSSTLTNINIDCINSYLVVKNDQKFIKVVENLIDPDEVQTIFFFQKFKKLLPKKLFHKILIKTSTHMP